MALLNYEDYFGFQAYEAAIKEAENVNKSFANTVIEQTTKIKSAYGGIIAELKPLAETLRNYDVNQKNAIPTLNGFSHASNGLITKLESQKRIIVDLEKSSNLLDVAVTNLRKGQKELEKEYLSLGNTEEKDIQRKKEIIEITNRITPAIRAQITAFKELQAQQEAIAAKPIPFTSNLRPNGTLVETGTTVTENKLTQEQTAALEQQLAAQAEANAAKQAGIGINEEELVQDALLIKARERLAFATSEENVQLKGYNLQTAEANAAAKLQAEQALGLSGAYKRLTVDLVAAKIEAKNLAAEFGVDSVQAKAATASAAALDVRVKAIDKTVGEAQRNVGNYGSAFSKAFSALRQFAYIIPGLGIAGIFNYIFEAISALIEKLDLFGSKSKELATTTSVLKDSLADSNSEYLKAAKNVDELRINIDLAKKGFIDKDEVVKEYNDSIGKTTGKVKDLNEAETQLNKNADAYIRFTLLKAAANLALEEAAKKALEIEQNRRKSEQEFQTIGTNAAAFGQGQVTAPGFVPGLGNVDDAIKARARAAAKNKADVIKTAEDQKKALTDVAEDLLKQAREISKNPGWDFSGGKTIEQGSKKLSDAARKAAEEAKKQLAALNELEKLREQAEADSFKRIAEDETKWLAERIIAYRNYAKKEEDLIRQSAENQIKLNKLTGNEAALVREKANQQIIAIQRDTEAKITNLIDKGAAERKALYFKDVEERKKIDEQAHKEMLQHQEDFENRIIELGDLTLAHQKSHIKEQKKDTKDFLDYLKKSTEDLSNAIGYASASFFASLIQDIKDFSDATKTSQDKLEDWAKTAIAAGNVVNELFQTASYNRIQQFEVEKNHELKIAGDNKAAQAAIEEKFAKKIAQEKRKQAIADKINALFQIAISTAVAIASPANLAALGAFTPLILALGIAEAALVAARPIPQFKAGTKNAPEGWAMVDEIGSELVVDEHGHLKEIGTNSGSRYTYLNKGDKVFTHAETKQILNNIETEKIIKETELTKRLSNTLQEGRQAEAIYTMTKAMQGNGINYGLMEKAFGRALDSRPEHITITDERGQRERWRRANETITYLNKLSNF